MISQVVIKSYFDDLVNNKLKDFNILNVSFNPDEDFSRHVKNTSLYDSEPFKKLDLADKSHEWWSIGWSRSGMEVHEEYGHRKIAAINRVSDDISNKFEGRFVSLPLNVTVYSNRMPLIDKLEECMIIDLVHDYEIDSLGSIDLPGYGPLNIRVNEFEISDRSYASHEEKGAISLLSFSVKLEFFLIKLSSKSELKNLSKVLFSHFSGDIYTNSLENRKIIKYNNEDT